MSADASAAYRLGQPVARTGFARLLHAEWTKLRTVRSWAVTVVLIALVLMLFSWLTSNGSHAGICTGPGPGMCHGDPPLPVGPGGEAVADTYYFVHQPLPGNTTITARVTSLSGVTSTEGNAVRAGTDPFTMSKPGLAAWAKAGLLVTPSLKQGTQYAAVMATGEHGVRMQSDYTHDKAGLPTAVSATSPQWLRLSRIGNTITGSDSSDGVNWTTISTARLHQLPGTLQVGMFVTSPAISQGGLKSGKATYATATFDHVSTAGTPTPSWVGTNVGAGPNYDTFADGRYQRTAAGYRIGGSGDIAPAVDGNGNAGVPGTAGLVGAFAALIVVAILGALFMTSEYRRGMIRTTFTATPRRGRVLAAKAIVLGIATFVPGVIGAVVGTAISRAVLRNNGNALFPMSTGTEVRVAVGIGALIAVTSVLALAVATITRRSASAITVVVVALIVPYILALTMSTSVGTWLLRLTPAAGFAVQQSLTRYPQVASSYLPVNGYYPLAPWAGLAVLCAWTVLTIVAANRLLRRRDV